MGKVLQKVDLEASQDPVWGFPTTLPRTLRPWVASSPSWDPQAKLHWPLPPTLFVGLMCPAWVNPLINDMTPQTPRQHSPRGRPQLPSAPRVHRPATLPSPADTCPRPGSAGDPGHRPVWDRRGWERDTDRGAEAGTGPVLAGERAAVTNGLCGGRGAGGGRRLIYLGYLCRGRGSRSG